MALYPEAKHRLIPKWNKVGITRHRRMNLHVAVSESASLFSMFSRSNVACSHFYVAKDGTVEQYIDTKYRSASDLHGNDSTISVETQGGVRNPDGEPWTKAQVEALAKLWKWARDTHDIKNQVAKNTQTNDNSSGLSWHRLGVQGNFKGRGGILEISYEPGGILYSRAAGKVCPGDAKILQIPGIWERANGKADSKPAPSKPVANKPSKPAPSKPNKGTDENKSIQTALKTMGLYKGVIDGVNGSMQKASVKAYQKHHGLVADGNWGVLTQAKFTEIKAVQKALKAEGYTKQTIDGYYGAQTTANVKDYQKRVGLVADGVAGPITLKKLGVK